jgi:hypothetical protein
MSTSAMTAGVRTIAVENRCPSHQCWDGTAPYDRIALVSQYKVLENLLVFGRSRNWSRG